ncbi:hypothetical protein D9M71_278520 [compost metagenome]
MAVVDSLRQCLSNGYPVQHVEHFGQHAIPVRPLLGQLAYRLEQATGIALEQCLKHAIHLAMIQRTEHRPYVCGQHLALAKGDGLVGQAHGIAHRAVGGAAQQPQGVVFERHVLDAQHMAQVLDHSLGGHVLQGELQATGQNGRRQLLRVRRRQDELHIGRRLFQGLEQGIERVSGQHVHFVDQVDLEAPAARCVLHVVEQLAGILDLGPARGVDFDQVDEAPLVDLTAHRTGTARRGSNPGFTVHAFGDDPRNGGLAHPTGTGEQVGVVQTLVVQRIDQGLEHMGLADHFAERARTPFTCKNLITHRKPSRLKCQRPLIVAEHGGNCTRCAHPSWPRPVTL